MNAIRPAAMRLPRLVVLRRTRQRTWRVVRDVVRDIVRFAIRRAEQKALFQAAASLTFTTVLSFVPLLTTVFGVLTAFPVFDRMRESLHGFLESKLMPEAISSSIFRYLDQFSANASSLTTVSVISFAVTSLTTLLTIDSTLNSIWGVSHPRPLAQRLITYWAILTVGPLLFGLSLSATSYLASKGLGDAPMPMAIALFDLTPLVIFTLSYAALYVYVPNRPVRWRDALIGGFVAALAFEIAKRAFAFYVSHFPTYTLIYGALAALPLLLLWIYYLWIITLAGALIAASLPAIDGRNWNRGLAAGDGYGDALRVLRVLYRARQNDEPGRVPGLDTRAIRDQASVDYEATDQILATLETDGIVIRTRQLRGAGSKRLRDEDLWLFAADASVITLDRIFRLFVFDAEHVAEMGLDPDDPLGEVVRAQRLVDGERSLESVFGENLKS